MDLPFKITLQSYRRQEQLTFFNHDVLELPEAKDRIPWFREAQQLILTFTSTDDAARLYIEDLAEYDLGGQIDGETTYFTPNHGAIGVFKHSKDTVDMLDVPEQTVPLRPGYYTLVVVTNGHKYYAYFQITPQNLDFDELAKMREEIEAFATGLARDNVRRKRDIPKTNQSNPDFYVKLQMFIANQAKLQQTIGQLRQTAKYQIDKRYTWLPSGRAKITDNQGLQKMSQKPPHAGMTYAPNRYLAYDIPENRWLKAIVSEFARFTQQGIQYLTTLAKQERAEFEQVTQYANKLAVSEFEFQRDKYQQQQADIVGQLTALHQMQQSFTMFLQDEIFANLPSQRSFDLPKALILSARYNLIYQQYLALHNQAQLPAQNQYYWKRTAYLYEMWTYIKTIKLLMAAGYQQIGGWLYDHQGLQPQIPTLQENTFVMLIRDNVLLRLTFNQQIGKNIADTDETCPIVIDAHKNKPDIRIDIYQNDTKQFMGNIILDAKYKPLKNILGSKHRKSDIEQLTAYSTQVSSKFIPAHLRGIVRPVQAVFALYSSDWQTTDNGAAYQYRQVFFNKITPFTGIKEFQTDLLAAIDSRVRLYQLLAQEL